MIEIICGGSGSGKSEYAEMRATELNKSEEPLIYLASMQPFGIEGEKRIARHKKLREGKGFKTIEKYTDYSSLNLAKNSTVLLECVSNLLANEMFTVGGEYKRRVIDGIDCIIKSVKNTIIVTNDIFSDGIVYPKDTEEYIRSLAEINCELTEKADRVIEVVYSIPVIIKEEKRKLCVL